jgi:hypothetical protein
MNASEGVFAVAGWAALLVSAALPCHAQETAADSTRQQETAEEETRRWGVGVQLSQLYGLSVRYALTERFTVQVAGIPVPLGDEITGGGRLLYKLYARPSYNFYVAGGASLFRGSNFTNPFTEESERNRGYTIFASLGGEYRFARRLGLGGGAGLSYLVQRSAVLDRNEVFPMIELGLHYYF